MSIRIPPPEKKRCSGCGACAAVCPASAIRMCPDAEGFRYPAVDAARCAGCGACAAACPMARGREQGLAPGTEAFAFRHARPGVLRRSASGGAFTALAEAFFARGGKACVYGAALSGGAVCHRPAESPAELALFCDSKYVESDLGETFRSVRARLLAGESVLFSGTPCQADGLKAALSGLPEAAADRLLLAEVVCNGVGSPLVWRKYLEHLGEPEDSPPVDYTFRDKRFPRGWGVSWRLADGTERRESLPRNFYWRLYIGGFISRPSCSACPYAGSRRAADLTLGDFHNCAAAGALDPASLAEGVSLVLANTEKGRALCRCLTEAGSLRPLPPEGALQPRLLGPAPAHPLRSLVLRDAAALPFDVFQRKYERLAGAPRPPVTQGAPGAP